MIKGHCLVTGPCVWVLGTSLGFHVESCTPAQDKGLQLHDKKTEACATKLCPIIECQCNLQTLPPTICTNISSLTTPLLHVACSIISDTIVNKQFLSCSNILICYEQDVKIVFAVPEGDTRLISWWRVIHASHCGVSRKPELPFYQFPLVICRI